MWDEEGEVEGRAGLGGRRGERRTRSACATCVESRDSWLLSWAVRRVPHTRRRAAPPRPSAAGELLGGCLDLTLHPQVSFTSIGDECSECKCTHVITSVHMAACTQLKHLTVISRGGTGVSRGPPWYLEKMDVPICNPGNILPSMCLESAAVCY